ncbi:MAG: hypothetical protein L0229_19520 [Blastocatellia bacterium]|nr:hypothetical protein [Blastocatellia bacterium]
MDIPLKSSRITFAGRLYSQAGRPHTRGGKSTPRDCRQVAPRVRWIAEDELRNMLDRLSASYAGR